MKKYSTYSFLCFLATAGLGAQASSLVDCAGVMFDPIGYLVVNPDVKAAGVDACAHFKSHGKNEGRNPNPKNIQVIRDPGPVGGFSQSSSSLVDCAGVMFDPVGYLVVNPDVKAAGMDACVHFKSHGKAEGRDPNPKRLSTTQVSGQVVKSEEPIRYNYTITNYEKGLVGDSSYQLDAPQSGNQQNGEMWDNIKISIGDDYKLKLTVDTRAWSCGPDDLRYKVESGNSWMTHKELEAIDFSLQAGNDIIIYVGRWDSGRWLISYSFVHLAGKPNTDIPRFVRRSPDQRMPQFVYNFPDFELPNRTNVIGFQQLDKDQNNVSANYLLKGFSSAAQGPKEKTFMGEYDDWAYSNGCPRGNQPGAIAWIKNNSIQNLYKWFDGYVISPAAGRNFVFLDFEAWGYDIGDPDVANKLGTLFKKFHEKNPTTIFTSYVNANPFHSTFVADLPAHQKDIENAKYKKSFKEIRGGFWHYDVKYLDVNSGEFTGETGNLGDYVTPLVGDYLHQINSTPLYATIQDLELANKHLKMALTLNWGLIEGVQGSDHQGFGKFFKKSNGFIYQHELKVPIQPSYAYNITVWSNFLGNGTWWWDEPLPFMEGYEFHGSNSKPADNNGYLSNDLSPKNFGSYHYAAQIDYDYVARGLFDLAQAPGITGEIVSPVFSVNGTSYSGDQLLPASAEFFKLPIVRARKFANGWVIVAVNHHLNHWEKQNISVNLQGMVVNIELRGQFSTVSRL